MNFPRFFLHVLFPIITISAAGIIMVRHFIQSDNIVHSEVSSGEHIYHENDNKNQT